jgi:hypothetical protein
MNRIGCLVLLGFLGVMAGNLGLTLLLIAWTEPLFGRQEILGVILALIGGMFVGWLLFRWHRRRIPAAMMAGQAGRVFAGLFGALLMLLPGPLTFCAGAALQLPPLQSLSASLMTRLAASLMRVMARRMMGGGGFPGGLR